MDYYKRTLKADCEELLSLFQQTESVRYEEFSAVWRQMSFSCIFYGKMEDYEKKAFSRLVLSTAISFFLPPYSFQIRVGGLYLLYGLYFSQQATPKQKIRVAVKDWEAVTKFQQDAVSAQHYDVVYILKQLFSEKAFIFTAMPKPLSFRVKRKATGHTMCEEFLDRSTRPQDLVSMEMLEELGNVQDHYEGLKAAISAGQSNSDINLIHTDLAAQLRNTVHGYNNWQKRQTKVNPGKGGTGAAADGTSDQQECSQRAQLIASIKSKSYGHVVQAPKDRRHRQVELDEVDTEAEQTQSGTHRRRRPPSLKARTNKDLSEKGVLEEDRPKRTQWCLTEVEEERKSAAKKKRRFKMVA